MHPAPEQVTGGAHLGGIDVRLRECTATEQGGNKELYGSPLLCRVVQNAQYGDSFRHGDSEKPPADFQHTVRLLLEHGADPLAKGRNGRNAIEEAERLQLSDIVNILRDAVAQRQRSQPHP
jgi:hypothetical protein